MRLKTLLGAIAWLVVLALLGFLFSLRSYRIFTQEELVAVVRCEAVPQGASHEFQLAYAPVVRGETGVPQRFPMTGDQWAIGGDFLKWHPWLNLLGIRSCHKLTRIHSRYLKVQDQIRNPQSVYELNGGTDAAWRWLYRNGRWIPWVEAVYGNSAYVMAQPGTRWGVYVTLSGYLIKPLRE